jgi:hypothetical protein
MKGAWFQALNLSSGENLVSKFAFFKFNLYRYTLDLFEGTHRTCTTHLIKRRGGAR